ncbi:unnamed protein product [Sphagnum compactum]
MSENPLASYFKQSNDPFDQMTGANDVSGRSFFDIIAECQDFNEKGQVKSELDEFYDKWPFPSSGASASAPDQFQLAIQEHLADPVKLLVNKYLGPQETSKRVLPNAESVQADANGLQILIVSDRGFLIRRRLARGPSCSLPEVWLLSECHQLDQQNTQEHHGRQTGESFRLDPHAVFDAS